MSASQFSKLPETVFMISVEYAVIIFLSKYCKHCCTFHRQTDLNNSSSDESDDVGVKSNTTDSESPSSRHLGISFEGTFESHSQLLTCVMFGTRLLSLGYVLGISVIAEEILTDSDGMFFFTNWNTKLISLYFLLTCFCSLVGFVQQGGIIQPSIAKREIRSSDDRISSMKLLFARSVHCLFEVCGGTAMLVTVVAFGLLDPSFTFWNVSCHFVTLVTLLVEMMLNSMYVRLDSIVLNVTWAFVYMIFVWIVVYTGQHDWPYYFLQTSSSTCYSSYSGLVLADLFFYCVWWGLSSLKHTIQRSFRRRSEGRQGQGNMSDERNGDGRLYSPVSVRDNGVRSQQGGGRRGGEDYIL